MSKVMFPRKPADKKRREELARRAEENWRRKHGIVLNRCVENHKEHGNKGK